MLNQRSVLLFSAIVLILLGIADIFLPVKGYFYGIPVFIALVFLIWGSASVSSGFYIKTLCKGFSANKEIAISFDDGPHVKYTPAVLEVLRNHHIRAAFFCKGKNIAENCALVKRMDGAGHLVANHSLSHHYLFDLFSVGKMLSELSETNAWITRCTGKNNRLFRPPYGVTNPTVAKVCRRMGMQVIGWSLKSRDTVLRDKDRLLSRLSGRISSGDVVLFHDTGSHVAEVLEEFINYAESNGYTFVRLDELFNIDAYE